MFLGMQILLSKLLVMIKMIKVLFHNVCIYTIVEEYFKLGFLSVKAEATLMM